MAISDLTKSIKIDPNNVDAFMCRAWCYAKIKKEMNFREDILKAAKLDPSLEKGLKDKYKLYFVFDEIKIALQKKC
jgi:Flp pilus assembly protein TadD